MDLNSDATAHKSGMADKPLGHSNMSPFGVSPSFSPHLVRVFFIVVKLLNTGVFLIVLDWEADVSPHLVMTVSLAVDTAARCYCCDHRDGCSITATGAILN